MFNIRVLRLILISLILHRTLFETKSSAISQILNENSDWLKSSDKESDFVDETNWELELPQHWEPGRQQSGGPLRKERFAWVRIWV